MIDERGVLMNKDTGQIEVDGEAMGGLYRISGYIAHENEVTVLAAPRELNNGTSKRNTSARHT